jgi:hypothetical protein
MRYILCYQCVPGSGLCTNFMQMHPMSYNWAQYEGFWAWATLVLPQCSNEHYQGLPAVGGMEL